ncbi:MAG: DUF7502 family protein [Methermicoccaceae archaeon]
MAKYPFVSDITLFARWIKRVERLNSIIEGSAVFSLFMVVLVLLGLPARLSVYDNGSISMGGITIFRVTCYTVFIALAASLLWIIITRRITRRDKLHTVERISKVHPEIRDMLMCACDNLKSKNIFMAKLSDDLSLRLKGIEYSEFFPLRRVFLSAVAILCVASITLTPVAFSVASLQDNLGGIGDIVEGGGNPSSFNEFKTGTDTKEAATSGEGGEDILFGEVSIATLEGGSIEMTLYGTEGADVLARDVNVTETTEFGISPNYPVFVEGYSSYTEELPAENRELISAYFEKLSEAGQG